MNGVYIGNNRVLISPIWGGSMVVPGDDLSISPILITNGAFEMPLTKFILKNVKPGNVVFDIGANIGYFTVMMGYLVGEKGKVISYEANPKMYLYVRDNINVNYLKIQSEPYNKAAYSSKDILKFYVTERFPANSSLYQRSEDYLKDYIDNISEINVEAEALDVHYGRFDKIDFIKMDIEGGEFQAFLGMKKLLKNLIVETIAIEWNKEMLKENAEPFYKLLKEYNNYYEYFMLSNEGDIIPVDIEKIYQQVFIPSIIMKKRQ